MKISPISSTRGIFTPMQPTQDHNCGINLYCIFCMENVAIRKSKQCRPKSDIKKLDFTLGITLRIGVDEMGIKTVDKMGTDKMGNYLCFKQKVLIFFLIPSQIHMLWILDEALLMSTTTCAFVEKYEKNIMFTPLIWSYDRPWNRLTGVYTVMSGMSPAYFGLSWYNIFLLDKVSFYLPMNTNVQSKLS